MVSASQNARARVRAQLTAEILDVARHQLARSGAAGLSLRAVARELGMVSSAVYRYFPSRDDLLTALIVEGYDTLGEAAERAEAAVAPADLLGRWETVCLAVREWALAHPHEYALLYGSPVPGYAAPQDTVAPAGRVGVLLGRIVADALSRSPVADAAPVPEPVAGRGSTPGNRSAPGGSAPGGSTSGDGGAPGNGAPAGDRAPGADGAPRNGNTVVAARGVTGHASAPARSALVPGLFSQLGLPDDPRWEQLGSALVAAWSGLYGAVSFELFGHTNKVVADHEAHFRVVVRLLAQQVGVTGAP